MEFKEIVATRRSIRKFNQQAIERDTLKRVIQAAIAAPSSRNSHSTSFIVVEGAERMERLAQMRDYGSSFLKSAPAAILVVADPTKTDLSQVNAAIAATTLLYAATEEGLAACWVHVEGRPQLKDQPDGAEAIEVVREVADIPDNCYVLCAIAIGHSDFTPAPLPEFDSEALVRFL